MDEALERETIHHGEKLADKNEVLDNTLEKVIMKKPWLSGDDEEQESRLFAEKTEIPGLQRKLVKKEKRKKQNHFGMGTLFIYVIT